MLSRHRISRSQLPQDDGGRTSERRAGSRAATTFTKLPSASAGARTKTAAAAFTPPYSPVDASNDDAVRAQTLLVSSPSRTTIETSFTARPAAIVCQVT